MRRSLVGFVALVSLVGLTSSLVWANKTLTRMEKVSLAALEDIDLEVKRGEFLALTGPNGSGKSTLLRIFAMLENPSQGKYILDGSSVGDLTGSKQRSMRETKTGFVPKSPGLDDNLSVFDNVRSGRSLREEQVRRALELVDLAPHADDMPGSLSGGQQMRVAIARAIVHEPAIILCDEPTSGLDSRTGAGVMNLLKQLNGDFTIVLSAHDEAEAGYASRVAELARGRLVEDRK